MSYQDSHFIDFSRYSFRSNEHHTANSSNTSTLPCLLGAQDMSLLSAGEHTKDSLSLLACSTSEGDVVIWELLVRASSGSITGSASSAKAAASASAAVEVSTPGFLCMTGGHAQRWVDVGDLDYAEGISDSL